MPISGSLLRCVEQALAARRLLPADAATDAYRVFNGGAEGIPGLVVDKFGPVLIAQLHEGHLRLSQDDARTVAEEMHHRLGTRAVYRKFFVRDRAGQAVAVGSTHHDPTPWIGEPVQEQFPITEYGLRFLIRPHEGFSVGLFLEHRENRRWVRGSADGRRVLNTFAYTCGFSVAAAAGGAVHVASVDTSKRYLEWGKQNFAANGLDVTPHRFYCSDVFDFYRRAKRQGLRYDLIILDPPTFSRQNKPRRVFVLEEQLGTLCAGAVGLLDPGGLVLLATNDRRMSRERLESELGRASQERGGTIIERPALPGDFAGDPEYSRTVIARIE